MENKALISNQMPSHWPEKLSFILCYNHSCNHILVFLKPNVARPISQQILDPGNPFDLTIDITTFNSSGNTFIEMSVASSPDWISSEYGSPREVSRYEIKNPERIIVKDGIAFIPCNQYGVKVFDVSNTSNPMLLSTIESSEQSKDVCLVEDILYIVEFGIIKTVNVSNPSSPVVVNTTDAYKCTALVCQDGMPYLYVGSVRSQEAFKVFEITDLTQPNQVGLLTGISSPEKMTVRGDYVYSGFRIVGEAADSFVIIDVSTPTNPYITGYDDYAEHSKCEIPINDEIAIGSDNWDGFRVYNTSNKTEPYILVQVPLIHEDVKIDALRFYNNMLYLGGIAASEFGGGVYIYNLTDILNPQLVYYYSNDNERVFDLFVDETYIYTAGELNGLTIMTHGNLRIYGTPEDHMVCSSFPITIRAVDTDNSTIETTFDVIFTGSCGSHGICIESNFSCECNSSVDGEGVRFYSGYQCEKWRCGVFENNDEENVCSGRGTCIDNQICDCDVNRTGDECEFNTCFGIPSNQRDLVCGGHGLCTGINTCFCDQGYNSLVQGGECTEFYCGSYKYSDHERVCGKKGKCVSSHVCVCKEGYEGNVCDTWFCGLNDKNDVSNVCSGFGECEKPDKCKCKGSRGGTECEKNLLYYSVMTPILSLFGSSFLVVMMLAAAFICCCLMIVICIGIICCLSVVVGLVSIVFKQKYGLKKFKKLKNFDLLMREQELEDDTSVAHLNIQKSLFEIDMKDIKLVDVLGQGGSSSVVYLASWKGRKVAFKSYRTRDVCSDQHHFDEFESELSVLGSVSHPSILRFFGCVLQPPRIGIVMEYCKNGDLEVFLKRFKKMNGGERYPINEKIRCLSEIIYACEYLHERSIIHRDLKLGNVLMDTNENCKLMDFGLSKIVNEMDSMKKTKRVGTSYYMAPEMINKNGSYDEKCDIFSFSIIIFVMFTELFDDPYEPFGDDDSDDSDDKSATKKVSERIRKSSKSKGGDSGGAIEFRVANDPKFRPDLRHLDDVFKEYDNYDGTGRNKYQWIKEVTVKCWNHRAERRMGFEALNVIFKDGGLTSSSLKKNDKKDVDEDNYDEDKSKDELLKENVAMKERIKELVEKVKEYEPNFAEDNMNNIHD